MKSFKAEALSKLAEFLNEIMETNRFPRLTDPTEVIAFDNDEKIAAANVVSACMSIIGGIEEEPKGNS